MSLATLDLDLIRGERAREGECIIKGRTPNIPLFPFYNSLGNDSIQMALAVRDIGFEINLSNDAVDF